MHLTLHPADTALVLEAEWGERHPLSNGGWLKRFVPAGFLMVYAPRTEAEIEVVMEIIRAAVWWVGGSGSGISAGSYSENDKSIRNTEKNVVRATWKRS